MSIFGIRLGNEYISLFLLSIILLQNVYFSYGWQEAYKMALKKYFGVSDQDYRRSVGTKKNPFPNPASVYPTLPGLDTLGFSVNARSDNPGESIKANLFQFNWPTKEILYFYPLYPDKLYSIPSDVNIRTVAGVRTYSSIMTTTDDFKRRLAIDFALDYSNVTDQGNNNAGAFSLGATFNFLRNQFQNNNLAVIQNRIVMELWQVVVNPNTELIPAFLTAQSKLLLLNPQTDQVEFNRFVESWGTHYIDSIIVGGILEMNSNVQVENSTVTDTLALQANLAFRNRFGMSMGNAALNATYTDLTTQFQQYSYYDLKTVGGSRNISNFFNGHGTEDLQNQYNDWLSNLIDNPVAVRLRLRDISYLIQDNTIRPIIQATVQNYLQGTIQLFVTEGATFSV